MNEYERRNIARLRPYLPECMVLLRKNGRFPLDSPCRIAAYGSGVRFTVKGGTGSGEVNSRYFVTVEDGLRQAGFDVVCGVWSYMYGKAAEKARKDFAASVRKKAREEKINVIAASMGAVMTAPEYSIEMNHTCDAAIYVVSRISGEGNDRLPEKGDFKLTDSEVRDILALDAAYERFMLVINTGGPVDLSPVADVGNILVLSQLGVETGAALADVLLGRSYPSGKLAATWSMYEDYSTIGDFGLRDDVRYREGIYVGYRYFDAFGPTPLFPFGHGLGYTDFELSTQDVSVDGAEVSVRIRVKNTGSFRGKEAPQVYVSCPQGSLDREVKSLAGFAKTGELKPEECEDVTITFDLRDLAGYDQSREAYVLEKGDYIVLTGSSSAEVEAARILRLAEDVTVRKAGSRLGGTDFEDCRNLRERDIETYGLSVTDIDPAALADRDAGQRSISHNSTFCKRAAEAEQLSDGDLAYLNIGCFDPNGLPFVIGDASQSVAGAAGESSRLFADRGIPSIIMADGPAGVRIARQYYEDSKGRHAVGSALPESMLEMLPAPVKAVMQLAGRPKKGADVRDQYCTAIPIGTAIAQSFNTGFAEMCGDIVAGEMDIYGIDLWLAPALNIHRNVLCGRNFEYFSEDPLITGKFAAALTRGVQSHPGRGVTIKHFAANNQETNRYASNSMVSERALREIYLKGFGICVREADPTAVMTSYNLLNGVHTSENRALTTDLLFGEFGFDGLVMTDWVVGGSFLLARDSKYGVPDAALAAKAGNSLFMPGSKRDWEEIMAGLREGSVSREQLLLNIRRTLRVLERLGK